MFKAVLLCAASFGCVAVAHAADLPAQVAPPVIPVLPFSWTGLYVGGNVGIATSDGDPATIVGNRAGAQGFQQAGSVPYDFEVRQSGVTAGGQLGYNYEIPTTSLGSVGATGFVLGVEADAAYTNLDHTGQYLGTEPVVNNFHQALDYLGTVRARAGLAFDRFFVYGTGGFAYGESHYDHTILGGSGGDNVLWSGGFGGMQTGYAVGGGFEYAIEANSMFNPFNTNAVTIGAEFIHFDLGKRSVDLSGPVGAADAFTDTVRTNGDIVRAKLNYKFDFAPAPVVARY